MSTPAYTECTDLDTYLREYGEALSERAQALFQPLHVPERDEPLVRPGQFRRDAFPGQANIISAAVKVLARDKAVILDAEAGAGKTLQAAQLVHAHAMHAPSKYARGPGRHQLRAVPDSYGYRALIMCPDHLPPKWTRELEDTLPNRPPAHQPPKIVWLRDWKDVLALVNENRYGGDRNQWGPRFWRQPTRPEWYIIGRDAAKLGSAWEPVGQRRHPDDPPPSAKRFRWTDKDGAAHKSTIAACPRCGGVVLDTKDIPVDPKRLAARKHKCRHEVPYLTGNGIDPPDWHERTCGEPLYQHVRKPRNRWAPCDIISKKLRGFFDYFVLDEAHEEKSDDSAQANAMGMIAASIPHFVGLTGTVMGGYAWHLFYLLYRTMPDVLVGLGYNWSDVRQFMKDHGKIETIYITKYSGEGHEEIDHKGRSNRQSKGRSQTKKIENFRPGIMPGLVPDVMLPATLCLSLDELADNLPPIEEVPIAVEPDAEQTEAYQDVYARLKNALQEMLQRGDKRLLGAFNSTLLGWLDVCHDDWGPVGYDDHGTYVMVCKPPRLSDRIRPKEQALLDQVADSCKRGWQSWVYVEQTDTRDVIPRLEGLLREHGYTVEVMRQSVKRDTRERWIKEKGDRPDVVLSHPKLVETGLDLFHAEDGRYTHNYNHLIFYQMRYNPFTVMQAGHRAWRIGQRRPCRTTYLYYANTAQAVCMALMGRKFAAAAALKGNLSAEGISLLAGGEDAEMAMARALVDQVKTTGRDWARVGSGGNAVALETDLPPRGPFRQTGSGLIVPEPTIIAFPRDKVAVAQHAAPPPKPNFGAFLAKLRSMSS